jgi:predicted membrane protein
MSEKKMEYGKAALAVVLITLSIVGFGLTWLLYVIFTTTYSPTYGQSVMNTVGYFLYWVLPTLTGMFSLMFMLLGVYLLYTSIKRPKNTN